MTTDPSLVSTERCKDFEFGRATEWLVTNGRGGYAMACVNQMLSRRYHGLLVAAVDPPVERHVLLAKLEATVLLADGLTYELATNEYPEAVHPFGCRYLASFSLRPCPTWRWVAGSAIIEQSLCMLDGEDTTAVRYRLVAGPASVHLSVRPLCTSRHFHHLARFHDIGPPTVDEQPGFLHIHWPGGRTPWSLAHNGAFKSRPDWYYQFVLRAEAQRGYDHVQDLFMPGIISARLQQDDPVGLVFAASTTRRPWADAARELARATPDPDPPAPGDEEDPLVDRLSRAAADFLVRRKNSWTLMAGYPWFADWGRDTFISLPGACLVTGRHSVARSIIETFAGYVDHGLIPNRFPDYGEPPAYNTADAALWFIHAIDRYSSWSGDAAFAARDMFPVIADIIEAHEKGTLHGIRVESDGLLAAGEAGHALTWMDALIGDRAVTPRIGKPVEICALWYNALQIAAAAAEGAGDAARAQRWRRLAARAADSFNQRFWNPAARCLYDVVDPDDRAGSADPAVRPSQLLALSLAHPVLDRPRWQSVVDCCERRLLTPLGLRTLCPGQAGYHGRYQGDVVHRDQAYHQGTAWPWLLGPFITAYVRAADASPNSRTAARTFLTGLEAHLAIAGIGSVSEVADGDPPHAPGGCPWQAWSVAEPLRALCEDILQRRPGPRPPRPSPRRDRPATITR